MQKETENNLKECKEITAMANSNGGKIILKQLHKKIINAIITLTTDYPDMNEVNIKAILGEVNANMEIVSTIKQAEANEGFYEKELDLIIKDKQDD